MDDRSYPVIGNAMQTRLDWDRMVESHTTAFDFFVIVVVVVIVHALANLGDVPLWTSRPLGCKTNMNGWFTSIHKCLYVLLFVNDKIHSVPCTTKRGASKRTHSLGVNLGCKTLSPVTSEST